MGIRYKIVKAVMNSGKIEEKKLKQIYCKAVRQTFESEDIKRIRWAHETLGALLKEKGV